MMGRQPIRVLIADDHSSARLGLRSLLSTWPMVEVVGEAADGREAVRLAGECHPHVVLMDVRMPALDGLEATRLIKSRWPEVRVIVLSMHDLHRADAIAAGADGFLVKGGATDELMRAILRHATPSEDAHAELWSGAAGPGVGHNNLGQGGEAYEGEE